MIKKVISEPYWYEMYCDICGNHMELTSINKSAEQAEYIYRCEECGHLELTKKDLQTRRNNIIIKETVREEDIDEIQDNSVNWIGRKW